MSGYGRSRVQGLQEAGSYRSRERDLAVTAAAIMTRTAATAIAMIHRTQSMPGHGAATTLAALTSGAYKPASSERIAVVVCGANTDFAR